MQQIKEEIEARLKDIQSLPSMPAIVQRLLNMAYDPDVDIKKLSEEISHDPAITASIIKLANSAYFRPSRQIRSVQEAIVSLGLNTVKDIIVIAASRGILQIPMDEYKMGERELWNHCLLVAEIASRLAQLKKTKTPSHVAFTAGLLHDVGKVVLIQFFKKIYRQLAMEMEKNPDVPFSDLEKKFLGLNQQELGGRLLTIWNFPAELIEAVSHVNHPETASVNPELSSLVHVANMISLAGGVGVDIGGMNEKLSSFALQNLGLTDAELQNLYHSVPDLCENLSVLSQD